jgi:Zn-dependent protease
MKVARIRGIDIRIHWTFWILVLFYLVSVSRTGGVSEGIAAVAFIFSIFACVLLHELGHAVAASWYGIPTRDITLLPIGGVARLERLPEKPVQELVVALAGPAVNVIIAVLLIIPVSLQVLSAMAAPVFDLGTSFFAQLMVVNVILVLFNLLPAFPMDGGRVVRSLLAMRWGHLRATQIAARLGRWMAVGFGIWALLSGNILLLVLAVFVFIAGTAELLQAKMRALQMRADPQYAQANPWQYTGADGAQIHYTYISDPEKEVVDADVIDAINYRKLP